MGSRAVKGLPGAAAWILAVTVAAYALIRVFGLESGYPLIPLLAYTPYVAALSLLVAIAAALLRKWPQAFLAGFAAVILVAILVPRISGDVAPRPDAPSLTLLSANTLKGLADPEALVEMVRANDVEVLSVQELTPELVVRLRGAGIEELLPYSVLEARPSTAGTGIYSAHPIEPLAGPPPVALEMPRAVVRPATGGAVNIVAAHPVPPQANAISRWQDALRSLPVTGNSEIPWILVGDFNATVDHREFRSVLSRGYYTAGEPAGQGLRPTWPSNGRRYPPVTIDHVLVDRRLALLDYDVFHLPGSDHRAVLAEVVLPPPVETTSLSPEADSNR